ncbi:MAG TPA: hypothetical protein PKM88_07290 [bacterium]|nr:hypothetical protein [bacterium]
MRRPHGIALACVAVALLSGCGSPSGQMTTGPAIQDTAATGAVADTVGTKPFLWGELPAADSTAAYYMRANDGFTTEIFIFASDGHYLCIHQGDIGGASVYEQGMWHPLREGELAVKSNGGFDMTLSSGGIYLTFDENSYACLSEMRDGLRNWLDHNAAPAVPVEELGQFTVATTGGNGRPGTIRLCSSTFANTIRVPETATSVPRADLTGMIGEIDRYLSAPYAGMRLYRNIRYRDTIYLYEDRGNLDEDAIRAEIRTALAHGWWASDVLHRITPAEYASFASARR